MPMSKAVPQVNTCPQCKSAFETGGRGRPKKEQVFCSMRCKALNRVVQPDLHEPTQLQLAYIAGLFDGEGSIILYDRGYGGRLQLRATVSNTFEGVMDWLVQVLRTGTVVRHVHPVETGYKDSLTWQCYGQNAVKLLTLLLPWLIIKKERAVYAIGTQAVVGSTARV